MKHLHLNIIYAVILIAVAAILYGLSPHPDYTSHGIMLPTNKTFKPVTADSVQVYRQAPSNAKVVGTIRIARHFTAQTPTANEHNVQANLLLAKKLAAKAGANGLTDIQAGNTANAGPLDASIVYAKAIRT